MRHISSTRRLFALFMFLLLPVAASAEWTLVGNTLNADATRSARLPHMAVDNGTPYVTWVESTASRDQIYVKFWNGSNWQSLGGSLNTNTGEHAYGGQIAIYDHTPYVAYSEAYTPDTAQHVYVKRWSGGSWNIQGGILNINATDYATSPSLAMSRWGTPYVAWSEQTGSAQRVYVKHYTGGGWVQDGSYLNIDANRQAFNPSLAMLGDIPIVAWTESTATSADIRVKFFNGSGWDAMGNSVNTAGHYASSVNLTTFGSTDVYAGFAEDSDTSYMAMGDIFVVRVKSFNGYDWQDVGGILNNSATHPAYAPKLLYWARTIFAAFNEDYDYDMMGMTKDHRMLVKLFAADSWSQLGGDLNLATGEYISAGPIVTENGTAYVAWSETSGSAQCLHVKTEQLPIPTPTPTPIDGSPTPSTQAGTVVQAYPNPARDRMNFRFSLSAPASVKLLIYNLAGEQVASLDEQAGAGNGWVLTWLLQDTAPGVYLVRVFVDGQAREEIKVAVVR